MIIQNTYWEQTGYIHRENELSKKKIESRIKQGCVFSPNLFDLYSEVILRELEILSGFIINGRKLNNIRYADDTDGRHRKKTAAPSRQGGKGQ